MIKKYLTILFFTSLAIHWRCTPMSAVQDSLYEYWNSTIDRFVENTYAEEVTGKKAAEEVLSFSQKMNSFILNEDTKSLIENIDPENFKSYTLVLSDIKPFDLTQSIRQQLEKKQGNYYYYLFDVEKFVHSHKDFKDNPKEALELMGHMDIRKFLQAYKNKLKWRVLYLSKETNFIPARTYIVLPSIPHHLMYVHGGFQYYVRKKAGKWLCIGFG